MDDAYLSTLIASMQHLFAGIIVLTRDERSLEEQLSEYEQWERYDPTRTYTKVNVMHEGRVREYHQYLVILMSPEEQTLYVVSREDPEMKALEKYCPCHKCQASYLNPLRYIWCDHCTRCLRTGKSFTDPAFIVRAKEQRELARKCIPRTWWPKHSIKHVETVVIGALSLVVMTLWWC